MYVWAVGLNMLVNIFKLLQAARTAVMQDHPDNLLESQHLMLSFSECFVNATFIIPTSNTVIKSDVSFSEKNSAIKRVN